MTAFPPTVPLPTSSLQAISVLIRSGQAHCARFLSLHEKNTMSKSFLSLWGAFLFRLRPLLQTQSSLGLVGNGCVWGRGAQRLKDAWAVRGCGAPGLRPALSGHPGCAVKATMREQGWVPRPGPCLSPSCLPRPFRRRGPLGWAGLAEPQVVPTGGRLQAAAPPRNKDACSRYIYFLCLRYLLD